MSGSLTFVAQSESGPSTAPGLRYPARHHAAARKARLDWPGETPQQVRPATRVRYGGATGGVWFVRAVLALRSACYNTINIAPMTHARVTRSSAASQPGAVTGSARLVDLRRREVTAA